MFVLQRLRVLTWIFALLFATVEARLVHLQFRTREFWEKEALAARTDVRIIAAPRGEILDRLGRPLAVRKPQHSLALVYSSFRQNSPVGRIVAACKILNRLGRVARAPDVRTVIRNPTEWARLVLERSDADFTDVPSMARADYGFYVRQLLGFSETEYRARRNAPGGRNAPYFTYRGNDRDAALADVAAAVAEQGRALDALARACEQEPAAFLEALDTEIAKLDSDVQRAMTRSGSREAFSRQERVIRRDLEYRARELAASVPYRAVFLVNLLPDVYGGLEVRDEERRHYPDDVADLAPVLIGSVRTPFPKYLEQTDEDRLLLLELSSRPPEARDQDVAVAIETLKVRIRHSDYLPNEEQGGSGLEGLLEPVLRGRRGYRYVETDSGGDDARLLEMMPPVPGKTVRVTLDIGLQQAAERVLARHGKPGAIVLLSPTDGAIRALASWPNPARREMRERYDELVKDPLGPLFNRAYRPPGNPPAPGSVLKILSSVAAIEAGTLTPNTVLECQRRLVLGPVTLHCEGSHGAIAIDTAFAKSCNVFYYRVGIALGIDRLTAMAEQFGFGRPTRFGDAEYLGLGETSISIGEFAGAFNMADRPSDTLAARSAIGQGRFDDVTPLQIAAMVAPIANGGDYVTPYLIDTIADVPARRERPRALHLRASTIELVRRLMRSVCEPGGTAGPNAEVKRDLRPWNVAAKTGTAQSWGPDVNGDGRPDPMPTHAWFAGYLPFLQPRLCFAVYMEHAGEHGGDVAAPLLNRLLEQPEVTAYLAEPGT